MVKAVRRNTCEFRVAIEDTIEKISEFERERQLDCG